jgi:MerR family mercuric resistance operon transcriptional regulator
MRIGAIARQGGITVEAVRFYEKQGLIDEPPRDESGYRNYPAETVRRVLFIKKSKELGFSLQEIKELHHLKYEPGSTCNDVKQKAARKVANIENRIENLTKIKEALNALIAACSGNGPASGCPIIAAISFAPRKDNEGE